MTVFTDIGGLNMLGILTHCSGTIVTTETISRHTTVIKRGRRPVVGVMTIVTLVTTGDVRRMFAGGNRTIVTGHTTAKHLGMIDTRNRRPAGGAMTILTDIGGLDVCRVLAASRCAVMTADTVACHTRMVKHGRSPASGIMAVITLGAAGNVSRMFAGGDGAIVAGDTATQDIAVIDAGDR